MGEPVIFDDGGSTRVKQLVGVGATGILDHLLEIKPPAPQSAKDTATGPFAQLVIAFLDANGTSTKATVAPIPMAANDNFECFSDNDQRVKGKITAGLDCEITILGIAGNKPIVEARHSGGQRRYIVSNAGPILNVRVNAAGPPQNFNVPPGTVYTMVVLT